MKYKIILCSLFLGIGALSLVAACNHTGKAAAIEPASEILPAVKTTEKAVSKQTAKIDTVIIKGMQFHPAKLTIHKGDEVVWINEGIVEHDVSTDVEHTWTSGIIKKGSSFKTTPDKSFKYICSIHPTMKGEIVVED